MGGPQKTCHLYPLDEPSFHRAPHHDDLHHRVLPRHDALHHRVLPRHDDLHRRVLPRHDVPRQHAHHPHVHARDGHDQKLRLQVFMLALIEKPLFISIAKLQVGMSTIH